MFTVKINYRCKKLLSFFQGELLFFGILVILTGCDIAKNDPEPKSSFTSIYDSDTSGKAYFTYDVRQLPDHGYLIMGRNEVNSLFLLKAKEDGSIEWFNTYPGYNNPLPKLLFLNNEVYVLAMTDNFSAGATLLKINDAGRSADRIQSFENNLRTLYASPTNDGGLIMLCYDSENSKTVILKFNNSLQPDEGFNKNGKKEFTLQINDVLLEKLNNHVYHLDPVSLPFFCGQLSSASGNLYYFNGFFKSDISTIFISTTTGDPVKRLTGYLYQKNTAGLQDLSGNAVALIKYEYENTYLIPSLKMDSIGGISNLTDFKGILYTELKPKSNIYTLMKTIKGRNVLLVAGNTKGNMVVLFAYDPLSGNLLGTKHMGERFPYTVRSMINTADNGIALAGENLITGRFLRPVLFKLSEEEISSMIP